MIIGDALLKMWLDDGTIIAYKYDYVKRKEQRINASDLHINPNSIDVTLAPLFMAWRPKDGIVDPYSQNSLVPQLRNVLEEKDGNFLLHPSEAILACTNERFECKKVLINGIQYQLTQEFVGRSTIARLFMLTHVAAGFGDVGFNSAWTLEIVNLSQHPIKLYPGMRIGQICFTCVIGCSNAYNGAYGIQHDGPKLPVLGKERFQ